MKKNISVFVTFVLFISLFGLFMSCELEQIEDSGKNTIGSPSPVSRDPDEPHIVIWEHPNYQGASRVLTATDTDLHYHDVMTYIFFIIPLYWGDNISSIQVYNGAKVTLYEHINGYGDSMEITGSIYDLTYYRMKNSNKSWNEQISSIYF